MKGKWREGGTADEPGTSNASVKCMRWEVQELGAGSSVSASMSVGVGGKSTMRK